MLTSFLTTLLIIDCLILIVLIIALQQGNEGGIGSAFGSGNSTGFFGASGGVNFIVRATWIAGTAFFILCMTLAWLKTRSHYGVTRELESISAPSAPAPESPSTVAPGPAAAPVQPPPAPQAPVPQPATP